MSEWRKLGGLSVSVVGLGCNNFGRRLDADQTAAVVAAALDEGINFFDTADVYGDGLSETYLGQALGSRRDEVVIATKFGHQMGDDPSNKGGSVRWIQTAVEDSLGRLNTDHIDLYQMHVPDPTVPIEETLSALDELVKAGKVLEIGNSNFTGEQIDEAARAANEAGLARFVSAQNHYSLLNREPEEEVIPACERSNLGLLPYFPLASGLLTGKYEAGKEPPAGTRLAGFPADRRGRFLNERNFEIIEQLKAFADESGHTILELAISWLAAQPTVASVIAGATKPEQVRANVDAVDWKLTDEEIAEISRIAR